MELVKDNWYLVMIGGFTTLLTNLPNIVCLCIYVTHINFVNENEKDFSNV